MQNFNHHLSEVLELPPDTLSACEGLYTIKKVKKGQLILQAGEVGDFTVFVEKGLLRMYSIDRDGKEHIIQFAPEHWLISDRNSLFFGETSQFYIEAIEDSEVLILDAEFFTQLVKRFPQMAKPQDILLQKHIRNLQNRVNALLGASAEERYLDFIKMYPDILLRVPQWMVASYLGITPESLSRVRKHLAERNFKPQQ
ncbi:Crp/Fnr family transcriptional regulator [Riemerella columbina]|uniref:Crp/Fnr family transcriptional regulator n=1 Tax=Riemerella columbina TaxID=103810 RepID=UPI00266F78B1|nr:Crp/Fnr family transcriptional regulator [Riemerella columbina]WKS96137.1 Crp/Fnr family transcriptional regulator [Riemerella columbina]